MKKILIIGNADSIFVKDFILQYAAKNYIIDLISYGFEDQIEGVRNLSLCSISQASTPFINQLRIYKKINESLKNVDKSYDAVVIHYIFFNLAFHIDELRKKSERLIGVVWGSDFYRVTSPIKKYFQKIIYKKVNRIVFTNEITRDRFLESMPYLRKKLVIARFGLPVLDEIDHIRSTNYSSYCEYFDIPYTKIKVLVGYNANLLHQQLLIIEKISILPKEYLEKIHLIFPLGYGSKESKELILQALAGKKISYTILDKFYKFKDIAKLRVNTDILINIQPSDQFSGSMQETLYAGGWVLTGSWLPYNEMIKLTDKIQIIDNKEEVANKLKNMIDQNCFLGDEGSDNIKNFIKEASSWSSNIKKWDLALFGADTLNES